MRTQTQVRRRNTPHSDVRAAIAHWRLSVGAACKRKLFPGLNIPRGDVLEIPAVSTEHCHALCTAYPKCTIFSFDRLVRAPNHDSFHGASWLCNILFLAAEAALNVTWRKIQMRLRSREEAVSRLGCHHVSVGRTTVRARNQNVTLQGDPMSTGTFKVLEE